MKKIIALLVSILALSACTASPYDEAKKYLESTDSGIERTTDIKENIEYDYWEKLDDSSYNLTRDETDIVKEYAINFDTEIISVKIVHLNEETTEYSYEWMNDKLISYTTDNDKTCKLVMDKTNKAYIVAECVCPSKTEYDKVSTPLEWHYAYNALVDPFLNTPLDFSKLND